MEYNTNIILKINSLRNDDNEVRETAFKIKKIINKSSDLVVEDKLHKLKMDENEKGITPDAIELVITILSSSATVAIINLLRSIFNKNKSIEIEVKRGKKVVKINYQNLDNKDILNILEKIVQ